MGPCSNLLGYLIFHFSVMRTVRRHTHGCDNKAITGPGTCCVQTYKIGLPDIIQPINSLHSKGKFSCQLIQSVGYVHRCLELVIRIPTSTNNPSGKSVVLEDWQKIQEPLSQGANLLGVIWDTSIVISDIFENILINFGNIKKYFTESCSLKPL